MGKKSLYLDKAFWFHQLKGFLQFKLDGSQDQLNPSSLIFVCSKSTWTSCVAVALENTQPVSQEFQGRIWGDDRSRPTMRRPLTISKVSSATVWRKLEGFFEAVWVVVFISCSSRTSSTTWEIARFDTHKVYKLADSALAPCLHLAVGLPRSNSQNNCWKTLKCKILRDSLGTFGYLYFLWGVCRHIGSPQSR